MERPDVLYVIYDATNNEVVYNRMGFAYIKPYEVVNEIKRLEFLYPKKNFELLIYWKK